MDKRFIISNDVHNSRVLTMVFDSSKIKGYTGVITNGQN